jgi:hypothetical protein
MRAGTKEDMTLYRDNKQMRGFQHVANLLSLSQVICPCAMMNSTSVCMIELVGVGVVENLAKNDLDGWGQKKRGSHRRLNFGNKRGILET